MTQSKTNISTVEFKDALSERYLSYALSTIMSRSLPDVRDGLKPVHRRLLYAMQQLKLDPKSGYKKCARVVGDVIGKYHPHGDVAVYDTMVRLAQNFTVRYPLIDGQGNFGSVDGDNPAAMRYTESRLTEVALELLRDIDKDTVDFRPTYDGSDSEPVVLPGRFPNLLANGAEGIAVGMATSIPPHNVDEICAALLHIIQNPDASIKKITNFIKAPDLPTGGVIAESRDSIVQAYETGKGSFRLRAKWEKEELERGMYRIVVTEIPYQVQKDKLVEKMAEIFKAKKLPLLADIEDQSADDIRIVLEPKSRTVDPQMLMESLFKLTDLEVRISLNMNVLDKGSKPRVMNLRQVLDAYLEHRHEILMRKSNFRLSQIDRRLEILDGFIIAYLNLDEVIKIIREEDDAKKILMKKFKLTETQVEAILNMRLRSLRKLEEVEIKREHKQLSTERKELNVLLKDEQKRWGIIADEISEIREKFGKKTTFGKRRSEIAGLPETSVELSVEAFVEKEPITVICSKKGWIRAISSHSYDPKELKFKDGDVGRFFVKAYTTDKLIVFSNDGKFYTIACNKIPRGRGDGDNIRLIIDLEADADLCSIFLYKPEEKMLIASSAGKGFIVKHEDVIAERKLGKKVLNLSQGQVAIDAKPTIGNAVAIVGENRKLLVFMLEEIPEMKRGSGVILQRYKNSRMSDFTVFNLDEGLSWSSGKQTRVETNLTEWLGKRGSSGKLPPHGFSKKNKFE